MYAHTEVADRGHPFFSGSGLLSSALDSLASNSFESHLDCDVVVFQDEGEDDVLSGPELGLPEEGRYSVIRQRYEIQQDYTTVITRMALFHSMNLATYVI